jgi:DNA-binding SARP family transcriptional activator
VLLEPESLRQLRMHTLDAWADKLNRAGRYGEAVAAAPAAVWADPLREIAHLALVRIHFAEGNLAEALRTYESFRTVLLEEMGITSAARIESLVSGLRRARSVRALVSAPPTRSGEEESDRSARRA